MTLLEQLRAQRDVWRARLDELGSVTGRQLTTDELREIDTIMSATDGLPAMDARIATLEDDQRRRELVSAVRANATDNSSPTEGNPETVVTERAVGGAQVQDPEPYAQGGQRSYFRDLTLLSLQQLKPEEERREIYDRMTRNLRHARDIAGRRVRQAGENGARLPHQIRALTTTDGAGGEFVPPLWMIDEYIALARAGRVTANLLRQLPLPSGTDTISLPKVATGTATAEQATQNTAVQNTDATTSSVTANVATIAGQQVVALQLIDQSPVNMDEILMADLSADYATKVGVFVISNNAAGKLGILNVASPASLAYTNASPTVALFYSAMANNIQSIHTQRFLPPDVIVMHPRRWAYLLAASDTTGRPLVVPTGGGQQPMNAVAAASTVASEGLVGYMQGLPVYVDPNIPTNLGAGTNQDPALIFRSSDLILFEGTPQPRVFEQTKADQLSLLLVFHNYIALHASRYPKSIAVVNGTGMVAPTF